MTYLQFIAHTHMWKYKLIFTKFPINEKNKNIWDIFVSLTCLSLHKSDIHVMDRDKLNTNMLQQTVSSLFVN